MKKLKIFICNVWCNEPMQCPTKTLPENYGWTIIDGVIGLMVPKAHLLMNYLLFTRYPINTIYCYLLINYSVIDKFFRLLQSRTLQMGKMKER